MARVNLRGGGGGGGVAIRASRRHSGNPVVTMGRGGEGAALKARKRS